MKLFILGLITVLTVPFCVYAQAVGHTSHDITIKENISGQIAVVIKDGRLSSPLFNKDPNKILKKIKDPACVITWADADSFNSDLSPEFAKNARVITQDDEKAIDNNKYIIHRGDVVYISVYQSHDNDRVLSTRIGLTSILLSDKKGKRCTPADWLYEEPMADDFTSKICYEQTVLRFDLYCSQEYGTKYMGLDDGSIQQALKGVFDNIENRQN
jgi:hypothetical protein